MQKTFLDYPLLVLSERANIKFIFPLTFFDPRDGLRRKGDYS